jgi:hypothetical protein
MRHWSAIAWSRHTIVAAHMMLRMLYGLNQTYPGQLRIYDALRMTDWHVYL